MSVATGLTIIFVCLLIQGFFSGSEIALINADRIKLRSQAEEGHRGATLALDLLHSEQRLLGTCLIGTNVAMVTSSSIAATLLLSQDIDGWAATAVVAPIVLIFGEALPKTILQHHAALLAPVLAYPLTFFSRIFGIFLVLVDLWSRGLVAVFGGPTEGLLTRQELVSLLEYEHAGPINADERRLIMGVLSMTDSTVEEYMTPLVQVVGVNETVTIGVAAETAIRVNHSRLPVYRRRIDHIVGLVHQADLLFVADDNAPLTEHVRPVRFVPDSKRADALFQEMRLNGEHFVVVVDEYGGCVGIVTLEDLLEAFVGDIADERETVRPAVLRLENGAYSIPGNTDLEDIEETTGLELPDGDYETVAGLVLAALGRIPEQGDQVDVPGGMLRVEEATDRAVRRVRLTLDRDTPAE